VELDALLDSLTDVRVERPPLLWSADADEAAVAALVDEMFGQATARGCARHDLVLRVNNVTVEFDDGEDEEGSGPAEGDYVALSVIGGEWPELSWKPGASDALLMTRALDARARGAGVTYGYARAGTGNDGSITVFLTRGR
jgi:hypothetical protein